MFTEKLIGVHCTHGLNRSGFLVCRYMIEEMGKPPLDAIAGKTQTIRPLKENVLIWKDKLIQEIFELSTKTSF